MTKNKNKKYKKDHFYYNGTLSNKFVNLLTNDGKKSYKYKLLLESLSISKFKMLLKTLKLRGICLRREYSLSNHGFSFLGITHSFSGASLKKHQKKSVEASSILKEIPNLKQVAYALPGKNIYTSNVASIKLAPPLIADMKDLRGTDDAFRYVSPLKKFKDSQNNINKLALICQAVDNVKPSVETRKVRVGGVVYQVPSIIQKLRQEGIAIRWLIMSASLKKRSTSWVFSVSLSQQILDSFHKEGQSWQKRDQIHISAANNRAYTRYRWW